jgi:hypothetical protein
MAIYGYLTGEHLSFNVSSSSLAFLDPGDIARL